MPDTRTAARLSDQFYDWRLPQPPAEPFRWRYNYGLTPRENAFNECRNFLARWLETAQDLYAVDFDRLLANRGIEFETPDEKSAFIQQVRWSICTYLRLY